jgi:hypothetical protein
MEGEPSEATPTSCPGPADPIKQITDPYPHRLASAQNVQICAAGAERGIDAATAPIGGAARVTARHCGCSLRCPSAHRTVRFWDGDGWRGGLRRTVREQAPGDRSVCGMQIRSTLVGMACSARLGWFSLGVVSCWALGRPSRDCGTAGQARCTDLSVPVRGVSRFASLAVRTYGGQTPGYSPDRKEVWPGQRLFRWVGEPVCKTVGYAVGE